MSVRKKFYGIEDLEKKFGRLTFGSLLESHRLCDEMSQKDFAKLLKISSSILCDLGKGRRLSSLKRASKIAKVLDYSEIIFIEVAIQDHLECEGLRNFKVSLAA